MKWKRATLTIIMFGLYLVISAQAKAQSGYSFGMEYGNADDDITVLQLNFNRDISGWFDERVVNPGSWGIATGLALTALNWNHENNNIFGSSVGLKFDYEIPFFKTRILRPYVEYELGAALISETVIGERDLSSVFHFKNQFGMGFKMRWGNFFVRVSHLSNGSLIQPNDGIDIHSAGVLLHFNARSASSFMNP